MDDVGPGFQPAGAFQAPRCPLTGKAPNAAQKHGGSPEGLAPLLSRTTGAGHYALAYRVLAAVVRRYPTVQRSNSDETPRLKKGSATSALLY